MGHVDHQKSASDLTVRCAVITCSDTRTEEDDASGAFIRGAVTEAGHELGYYGIVRDDSNNISAVLDGLAKTIDVALLSGGTGLSKSDSTYDAVASRLAKEMAGFGELFRMLSYDEIGPASMLSRAVAGLDANGLLIFCMPGSTAAVRLAMEKLIIPELRHLVWETKRR